MVVIGLLISQTKANIMTPHVSHYIHGSLHRNNNEGRRLPVFNPAHGEVIREVICADDKAIADAVSSAQEGFVKWSGMSPSKRAGVLFAFRELLVRHTDSLADLIGQEHGKTIADAKGEIQRGIDVVEFATGIPHLIKGAFNSNVGGGIDLYSMREPLGVVVGITPFNFPFMIPLWMGVMAVACGNAFINKPSERDPSTPNRIGELWSEAGLPDGVWNVLHGDKEAVDALLVHPEVAAVSFVGSTPVGEHIYRTGTASGKRVQAFCGAKNHMVITPDADLDRAADALIGAGYGSAGERCMAISVAMPIGEETADKLVERLAPRVQQLQIGPWNDSKADMGPLITPEAKTRVERLIESGINEGAELVVDGRGYTLQGYEKGNFMAGSLFDRATTSMEIYKTEIFGPVLTVARAQHFDEAVEAVNNHEYGNGVALFTSRGDLAQAFTNAVDVGMIGINVPIPVPMAFHHFGGSKRSKFGDTQMHGPESVIFFTKMKTVSARWFDSEHMGDTGAQFAMPTNR